MNILNGYFIWIFYMGFYMDDLYGYFIWIFYMDVYRDILNGYFVWIFIQIFIRIFYIAIFYG